MLGEEARNERQWLERISSQPPGFLVGLFARSPPTGRLEVDGVAQRPAL